MIYVIFILSLWLICLSHAQELTAKANTHRHRWPEVRGDDRCQDGHPRHHPPGGGWQEFVLPLDEKCLLHGKANQSLKFTLS